jgi:hypothetical protein
MRARFDRIFRRRACFVTLDRLLARLHANKPELQMVLQRPEIPLHTNGSENEIRCQVTRRKISAGTRSDAGRDCRDALFGLAKTCAKHGIAFSDYLGSRLNVQGQFAIPPLSKLVRRRELRGILPLLLDYCKGPRRIRFLIVPDRLRESASHKFRSLSAKGSLFQLSAFRIR